LRWSTMQFMAQTMTHQQISVIAACSINDHGEEKRTEQNRTEFIVCCGKSEAEVTRVIVPGLKKIMIFVKKSIKKSGFLKIGLF